MMNTGPSVLYVRTVRTNCKILSSRHDECVETYGAPEDLYIYDGRGYEMVVAEQNKRDELKHDPQDATVMMLT
jgi:hypothetical protein